MSKRNPKLLLAVLLCLFTSCALPTLALGVEADGLQAETVDGTSLLATSLNDGEFEGGDGLKLAAENASESCENASYSDGPSHLKAAYSGDFQTSDDSFTISGTANYDAASQVLVLANKERAAQGLSPLVMDKSLQAAAMRRAVEISLLFQHTRPDGSSCFSADPTMSGENIAAGSATAEGAMNLWMNSQGHRANILDSGFACIGVGCVRVGGITYWAQCFGGGVGSNTTAGTGTAKVSYATAVDYDTVSLEGSGFNLNEALDNPLSMASGKAKALSVGVLNAGWAGVYCPLDGASFTWTSSNPSVAAVTNTGVITAGKAGSAVVTAKSSGGKTWSITVKVAKKSAGIANGKTAKVGGVTYKVTSNKKSTAVFQKAKKGDKSVTLPASVTINGRKYAVVGIAKNAFKGTKAKTVTVKSKKLTKKSVKNCFKASKVRIVKVKVGNKKANKTYVKKYKKIFVKKNCGAKVTVK